jgi:hypothetical protein
VTGADTVFPGLPTVGTWRRRARAARRDHHRRRVRDNLADLYMGILFALVYGFPLYLEVDRHLRTARPAAGGLEQHWLWIAALMAGAGLAWRGLRALGPVMVGPAEQHWVLASPLPRRGFLVGRLAVIAVTGAALGALTGFTVVLLGSHGAVAWVWTVTGGLAGLTLAGASVAVQAPGEGGRASPMEAVGTLLLATGALLAVGVIAAHYGGRVPPSPSPGAGVVVVLAGVPVAAAGLWRAWRALPNLDRGRLGTGTQLASTIVVAAVWLDIAVLWAVLEERRCRRVGQVRSHSLRGPVPLLRARTWGLLQADLVRIARRPGLLAILAGLTLAQYGVAAAAPALAGVSRVVMAYLLAGRLMGGLRTVARSDALRRALGGSNGMLRVVHVVVPGLTTFLWWALTAPTDPAGPGLTALLAAGTVAAAYRASTRGPVDYGIELLETPFGPVPIGLVLQLGRGLDLLGAVIAVRVFLG